MNRYQKWVWLVILFLITIGADLLDAAGGNFNFLSWRFIIHVLAVAGYVIYAWVWPRFAKNKNS